MTRMEPPPLATWILEHCIPGKPDQALAGDLLEEYEGGRSNGWYWRQVLAAWVVGWVNCLSGRMPLVVFAALWSMLAPAWAVIGARMEHGNLPWPVAVAWWAALNVGFLWTGMLLFAALHRRIAVAQQMKKVKGAFALAAGLFLPVYFFTFVLSNLFAWPGLAMDWRTLSPLTEILDFHVRADALRLPYFATLLWAMWRIAPALGTTPIPVLEWGSRHGEATGDLPEAVVPRDPRTVKRALVFLVGTGLLNALIAGVVLCRLPAAQHPSVASVLLRAALYVVIGAVAGMIGSYVYWHSPTSSFRDDPPLPFSLFALVCAAGWMWVPAMVLFSEQLSALSAAVATIGALVIAGEMGPESEPYWAANETPLFAGTLYRTPAKPDGYLLALALYGAGWAIAGGSNTAAATLLVMAAILFKLRTTFLRDRRFHKRREYRRAALRVAAVMLPAIAITFWALLDGVAHRNRLLGLGAGGVAEAADHSHPKKDAKSPAHVGNGYESVVLWPYPPKKQIVAPVQPAALLAPGTKEPVVIRFTGEYWYLQPPDMRPGPLAHRAVGTPVDLHIASNNSFPLTMQAHQFLRSPVRVGRCRALRVDIANRETAPGDMVMAVWLKQSAMANGAAVYLGEQPVTSVAGTNGPAARETLVFAVPPEAKVRTFDEITVMLLPDSGHRRVGPRIAIDQFELVPK